MSILVLEALLARPTHSKLPVLSALGNLPPEPGSSGFERSAVAGVY